MSQAALLGREMQVLSLEDSVGSRCRSRAPLPRVPSTFSTWGRMWRLMTATRTHDVVSTGPLSVSPLPVIGPTFCSGLRIDDGAVLTPGVVIGEEAMVAAGSIVTRDVPPKSVVKGTPAKVVNLMPTDALLKIGEPSV